MGRSIYSQKDNTEMDLKRNRMRLWPGFTWLKIRAHLTQILIFVCDVNTKKIVHNKSRRSRSNKVLQLITVRCKSCKYIWFNSRAVNTPTIFGLMRPFSGGVHIKKKL
jgi:hypothetical protein